MKTLIHPAAKKSRYESMNFQTALVTLVLSFLAFNGIQLDADMVVGAWDTMVAGNYFAAIALLPPLVTAIMRIVKKAKAKELDWGFFKKRNTIAQLVTVAALALSAAGVIDSGTGFTIAAAINAIISAIFFSEPPNQGGTLAPAA